MKIWPLLLVLLAGCSGPLFAHPPYGDAAKVSVRLDKRIGNSGMTCSGWASAHHAITTDEHCLAYGTDGFKINGRTAVVLKVIKDGNDHVILLTDLYFKDVAVMGPRPALGDELHTYGNPAGEAEILLTGRVAGWRDTYKYDGWGTFHDVLLVDSNDWRGCSGAAVFDSRGRVVAVVNAMWPAPNDGWRLTAAFGLRFTPEQLAEASAFDGKDSARLTLARLLEDFMRLAAKYAPAKP